jgi:SP family general alpha glucoside:H+ symporter-like MFS transporter
VRRGKIETARHSIARLRSAEPDSEEVEAALAYVQHITRLETAEVNGATFLDCFRGTNLRRTEINCVVWAAQILCGNAILGYSVVFLQAAGFNETQSLDLNIALSACYIVGGVICWFRKFALLDDGLTAVFPRVGRATIYMSGLAIMLVALIVSGGLAFSNTREINIAIGVLFIFQTLVNMSTVGPACYPIVAETPSGKLRYKTIVIGRFVYNLTGVFSNILTPRMVNKTAWNWGAHTAWFYAGTNALCLLWCWFRLPETKDRPFGEIDLLFEARVPARKFRITTVDRECPRRGA